MEKIERRQEIIQAIRQKFKEEFVSKPLLFRAPGRVNIIGEHTDYNEGFVLPAAIDKSICVGIAPRADDQVHLYSLEFGESFSTTLQDLKPVKEGWPNYILGVAAQLLKKNYGLKGFDLVFHGDVPIGSGLSSSAAVECAVAFALNQVFELEITPMELALVAQKAEHEFAGVMCGIMDQFASVFGKKDHVMKLDCRSMEYEYLPIVMEGYKIVLLNTNVKHSLASSEYNTRRKQCEEGVEMVKEYEPAVNSLRDVSLEMLDKYVSKNELVFRRCHYVVKENLRLLAAAQHLKKGDIHSLGKLMFESHYGLSEEYEVSCKELDFLVEEIKLKTGVLGARMMGGGFGGCTINIIREENLDNILSEIIPSYNKAMNLDLSVYVAQTDDGAGAV
jgi:galactokinase